MRFDSREGSVFIQQNISSFYTGFSSILTHVKEYVLNQFPEEYFKKVTVETAMSSSLMTQTLQDGMPKMSYPYMNIGVTIPSNYDERTTRPLLDRSEFFLLENIRQNYPRVLVDPDDNFTLGYTYEWTPTSYEFRMTTNTFMNSMNLMNWIRTKFGMGMSGVISNAPLEFELPQSIVKTIAELQGFDLTLEADKRKLDRYLMSVGRMKSLIRRKTSATTGQDSYFMEIGSDIQVTVDDLQAPDSIIKVGQAEGDYQITFRVNTNAYFPVAYIMKVRQDYLVSKVEKKTLEEIRGLVDQPLVDGMISLGIDVEMVDARTDIRRFKTKDGLEAIGHHMYEWRFVYGSEQVDEPIVKLFDLIDDPELKRVHSYAVEHSLDLEALFHFDGYKVAYDQGDINFVMDYENFQINIENSEFSEVLIRFYLNRAMYEVILKAMETDSYFFNKNIISFMDIWLWNDELQQDVKKRVRINYFKNLKEMYDTDILKSIKIRDKYGYGYLDIKPYVEDKNRTDDMFLVVLGYERELKAGKRVPILYEIILID